MSLKHDPCRSRAEAEAAFPSRSAQSVGRRWRASEGVGARPPQHLLLNSIEKHKGFVYDGIAWDDEAIKKTLLIGVRPRTGSRGHCSGCGGYPRLPRLRAASHRLPEMRCHRRDGAVGRWRAPAHTHLHLVSLAVWSVPFQSWTGRMINPMSEGDAYDRRFPEVDRPA